MEYYGNAALPRGRKIPSCSIVPEQIPPGGYRSAIVRTMAKEKKNQDGAPAEEAKAAAAPAAAAPVAPKISTKPAKIPKLEKKNKVRLPRKQKKAAQKAALAQGSR